MLQNILARLLKQQLGATYVMGSLQLAAIASITAPAPSAGASAVQRVSVQKHLHLLQQAPHKHVSVHFAFIFCDDTPQ